MIDHGISISTAFLKKYTNVNGGINYQKKIDSY